MQARRVVPVTPVILLLISAAAGPAQQTPPAFKAETNLVLVPVVVRDAKGEPVANLSKADFKLFDNGKEQPITSFSMEETSGRVAQDRSEPPDTPSLTGAGDASGVQPKAAPMVVPEHFVALLFDDQHFKPSEGKDATGREPGAPDGYIGDPGDLMFARDAARKMIKTLKPGDRVAVFTSTGAVSVDFTNDPAQIEKALMKLQAGKPVLPPVGTSAASKEIEDQTEELIRFFGGIVKRMAYLPGQRTAVLISPGLTLHGPGWSSVGSTMNLIDHAIQSGVVINSLDARGLSPDVAGAFWEFQMRVTDGTGGRFIRDHNDLKGGLDALAGTPKYIYVLGFSPQNVKQDGSFHKLTVKLADGHKFDVQARAGYNVPDAQDLARQKNQPAPASATPQVSEAETNQLAESLGIGTQPSPQTPSGNRPTFRADTKLVLVPVVVRDRKGDAVGSLTKDDFQLFAEGKARNIASFSVEETTSFAAEATGRTMPDHFVALMFDDTRIWAGSFDVAYARTAALKYLDTLQPGDRVAFFTPSGQNNVDFTDDRSKIKDALMKLVPCAIPGQNCPAFMGMLGEQMAQAVIRQFDKIVTRMALLPGQRTLVFVSMGLPIQTQTWSAAPDTMRLVDHAIRSRVVINSLDVVGLDPLLPPTSRAWDFQLRIADGTGGRFIRDTNDFDGALRQVAATPKYIYLLGFSPDSESAKIGFHKLEVKVRDSRQYDVQARAGYYDAGAPQLMAESKPAAPDAKIEAPKYSASESNELAKALDIAPPGPAVVKAPTTVKSPASLPGADEMTTTEQPATFRTQANLVEVPVVVRDSSGHTIAKLKAEDFRVFDKGKRQDIAKFSIVKAADSTVSVPQKPAEAPAAGVTPGLAPAPVAPAPATPASPVPATLASPAPATPASPAPATPAPTAVPTRFFAFVFDDLHMRVPDVPQVRAAVLKYLSTSVQPGDRVALFTTSGHQQVDFTNTADALTGPLNKIAPSPLAGADTGCGGHVSFFQAVQIDREVGLHPMKSDLAKSLPLRVADEEFADLGPNHFDIAVRAIQDASTSGLQESRNTLATLRAVVQRMASMPGQRSVVLVSPGFFVSPDLQIQNDELMALSIRSKVLINTIDARGVWTNQVYDACRKGDNPQAMRDETAFHDLEGQANTDALLAIAEDTGGASNLNNDFFGGVMKAAAVPETMYVLGFVPQNLKFDGSFHALKVTVGTGEKTTLQARRGYWETKQAQDETAVANQEIQGEVFSRDEVQDLPVEMHTRWTKNGDQAKLSVLTSVDLKLLHLRKNEDRNCNEVTIVAALFDTNGNFVAGTEKVVKLRLRDETVANLQQKQPATIGTDFDVKPGGYLVRLVVRDAEGRITAENAAVQVQQ